MPQSGKSKGLALMLDAHSDLITKSSTPNEFQVIKFHQFKIKSNDATDIKLLTFQGFEVVIDSSNDYPLAKRDSIMIRPGHTVSE